MFSPAEHAEAHSPVNIHMDTHIHRKVRFSVLWYTFSNALVSSRTTHRHTLINTCLDGRVYSW